MNQEAVMEKFFSFVGGTVIAILSIIFFALACYLITVMPLIVDLILLVIAYKISVFFIEKHTA